MGPCLPVSIKSDKVKPSACCEEVTLYNSDPAAEILHERIEGSYFISGIEPRLHRDNPRLAHRRTHARLPIGMVAELTQRDGTP